LKRSPVYLLRKTPPEVLLMRNLKKIATALLVTLAIGGLTVGTFAAFTPTSTVIAGGSNLPGEWDVG